MLARRLGLANRSGWIGRTLTLLLGLAAGAAHADDLPEYRLKAAFLYNFAAFTEWPAELGATLNVCVLGTDPFGTELDALAGKPVGQRAIAVHRKASFDGLKPCQVVFVAPAAWAQWPKVQEALRGLPVLTVADTAGAARAGVALNMTVTAGRVAFDANLESARAARLNLSSKLLRLAKEVIQ